MDVVEFLVVLGRAAVSACSDPVDLTRRTRRKPELGVDRAVDDAGLEAGVPIRPLGLSLAVLGSRMPEMQGCGLEAGAKHEPDCPPAAPPQPRRYSTPAYHSRFSEYLAKSPSVASPKTTRRHNG